MTNSIYRKEFKKLGINGQMKKMPDDFSVNHALLLLDPEEKDEHKRILKELNTYLKITVDMMNTVGFIPGVESGTDYIDTYYFPYAMKIDYTDLFLKSFTVAALLHIVRETKVAIPCEATESILWHYENFLNEDAAGDSEPSFGLHAQSVSEQLKRDKHRPFYFWGLALTFLHRTLVSEHREIYEALSNKDSAAYEAIIKRTI